MQENLKAKYGVTTEELKSATDKVNLGNCDSITFVALDDLLKHGDIEGNAKSDIKFKSSEHELFYNEMLAKCRDNDCYHRALMYTLGINEDTRRHINEIYNFGTRCIKLNSLKAYWVTSSDLRAMRLAFNLFTDNVPENTHKERYAVGEIFNHRDGEYFFQAIKLRYDY